MTYNFDNRIQFIENYIDTNHPWRLLIHPLWITFVSLTSFLALSYIAMAINLGFVKWVKPWIVRKIDRNSIVTKEETERYKELLRKKNRELVEFEERFEEEKEARVKSENERTRLDNDVVRKIVEIEDLKNRPLGKARNTEPFHIFFGRWKNTFSYEKQGKDHVEYFTVNVQHDYVREHTEDPVKIRNVFHDHDHKILYFEKHVKTVGNTRILTNYLKEVSKDVYEGCEIRIDGDEFKRTLIRYTREEKASN